MPKKLKGILRNFSTSILSQKIKNLKGDHSVKNLFRKKSLTMPKKNERGDTLVSPGNVYKRGKRVKLFWFSSLGQMIQLGTINIRKTLGTILVSSRGLKKTSHYNSRVSLYEAPTKNYCFAVSRISTISNNSAILPID